MTTLTFLGAAGTVTGSKYLLEHDGFRLLVDCGLFQGLKELRLRNWEDPPIDPKSIDQVVLTHAHLDHSGYLPVLARHGYAGSFLATSATSDLCKILLPDSGHLMEEDARFANRRGFSKHRPAMPLYGEEDARAILQHFRSEPFDTWIEVHDGIRLRFLLAGHILGAAFIEVRLRRNGTEGGEKVILFSGDLGRPNQPILPDPVPLPACDHLLLESTYGDRDHPAEDPKDRLAKLIHETVARGGTMLIPAFAVGRTEHVLYLLHQLQQEDRLPRDIPIYIDSPMAIEATGIVLRHPEAQDQEAREQEEKGKDPVWVRDVHLIRDVEESKGLNNIAYPAIIISASGMAEGGRILHHLAYKLPDHRSTVLFVGFQAAGTRGRALRDGARVVRIHGQEIPVRAQIVAIDGLSAHADRGEILSWLEASGQRLKVVHLVHGEPAPREALASRIREERGLNVHLPAHLEKVTL